MDENIEFLNYIYQNCSMGIITIEQLIGIAENEVFINHLKKQLTIYQEIKQDTIKILKKKNCDELKLSNMTKIISYITINVKTLTDKSSSHIADMMIQGSTMGVIEITKNLNQYKNADSKIIKIAKHLLNIEEKNIEDLKEFLI